MAKFSCPKCGQKLLLDPEVTQDDLKKGVVLQCFNDNCLALVYIKNKRVQGPMNPESSLREIRMPY